MSAQYLSTVANDGLADRLTAADTCRQAGDPCAARAKLDALAVAYPFSWQIEYQYGLLAQTSGDLNLAVAYYRRAILLSGKALEPLLQLGLALYHLGLEERASARFAEALRHAASTPLAQLGLLVCTLRRVPSSQEEASKSLANYRALLQEIHAQWIDQDAPQLQSRRDAIGILQPFSLAYYGGPMLDEQRLYGELLHTTYPSADAPALRSSKRARIRIGIVSAFIRDHSNWWIPIKGWLEHLDRDRFEIIVYSLGQKVDAQTQAAQQAADAFHAGLGGTEDWIAQLRQDAPDVLIYPETGMDILTLRLASLRLAPVQASSWGHPLTSGLPSMDLFLSSDLMEPGDGESHYCERLVRLPNSSLYLEPIDPVVPAQRVLMNCDATNVIYWCGQNLAKFRPQHDDVFARIAAKVPNARFAFIEDHGPAVTARMRKRLKHSFSHCGQSFDTHVRFLPACDRQRFRSLVAASDVFLDSIGWSGCNTAMEAIAHNVPLLTWPGDVMRARHSFAFLRQMGLAHRAVGNFEEYVACAVALGRDASEREAWSNEIRTNKDALYHDLAPVRALETALETAVDEARNRGAIL